MKSSRRYQAHPVGPESRYEQDRLGREPVAERVVRFIWAATFLTFIFIGLPWVGAVVYMALGLDPLAGLR
jgi:hypothetical protein